MNFGEIYDAVVYEVWGDVTPPAGATARLTGENGIIADCHRNIQKLDNYWFMHETTAFEMIDDTQGYNLPDDFKEEVELLFQVKDETYFGTPLTKVGMHNEQEKYWQDNTAADYPTHYAVSDGMIVLYPPPEVDDDETLYLHMCYWKFLDRPTEAFTGSGYIGSDDLTENCAEGIIYHAAYKMLMGENEIQKATIMRQMGDEAIRALRIENSSRIYAKLNAIEYQDV